jgi:acetate kinase
MAKVERAVLAINGGSSSIKFAVYAMSDPPERRLHGSVDRIGTSDAKFLVDDASASRPESCDLGNVGQEQAADFLIDWLDQHFGLASIDAFGHRVATGGVNYVDPQRVTDDLLEELRRISAFAPEHLPFEIALIERFRVRIPDQPHVVCFDTTFHRDMPTVARILPLPRRLYASGIARYGFHGLSYAYLMETLTREAGPEAAQGRVIVAHLGNGASLAAVHRGKSIDTTMAFTPASGVPMSRRSGDLDPGLVGYLAHTEGMTAEAFNDMVNRQSGLLGVSETSGDVRDLLAREADDARAAEALALFCYEGKKRIGAYAAALGGVDTLVFAGGIGENASVIRARICERLDFLGLELDDGKNAKGEPVISSDASRVAVRVMRTNEEIMIARTTARVLGLSRMTPTKPTKERA